MAKTSVVAREKKRRKTVQKYAAKRAELKEQMRQLKTSEDFNPADAQAIAEQLQKLLLREAALAMETRERWARSPTAAWIQELCGELTLPREELALWSCLAQPAAARGRAASE